MDPGRVQCGFSVGSRCRPDGPVWVQGGSRVGPWWVHGDLMVQVGSRAGSESRVVPGWVQGAWTCEGNNCLYIRFMKRLDFFCFSMKSWKILPLITNTKG